MANAQELGVDEFVALAARHGDNGLAYLREHYPRLVATRRILLSTWTPPPGARVLDVGAHWLHQSLLYALDGSAVTALDVAATLSEPGVRSLAQAHGIALLPNNDLENPAALAAIENDTFDLVLFTEVIEHLAFNPVAMWRELYRVMKPGARLVVTTPNYYALRGRVRQWGRALRGLGGGVPAEQVVTLRTFSHHWKEYSRRELLRYFALLSPDFACRNFAYTREYMPAFLARPGARVALAVERALPALRPDMYLEVQLMRKDKGIVVEPHW